MPLADNGCTITVRWSPAKFVPGLSAKNTAQDLTEQTLGSLNARVARELEDLHERKGNKLAVTKVEQTVESTSKSQVLPLTLDIAMSGNYDREYLREIFRATSKHKKVQDAVDDQDFTASIAINRGLVELPKSGKSVARAKSDADSDSDIASKSNDYKFTVSSNYTDGTSSPSTKLTEDGAIASLGDYLDKILGYGAVNPNLKSVDLQFDEKSIDEMDFNDLAQTTLDRDLQQRLMICQQFFKEGKSVMEIHKSNPSYSIAQVYQVVSKQLIQIESSNIDLIANDDPKTYPWKNAKLHVILDLDEDRLRLFTAAMKQLEDTELGSILAQTQFVVIPPSLNGKEVGSRFESRSIGLGAYIDSYKQAFLLSNSPLLIDSPSARKNLLVISDKASQVDELSHVLNSNRFIGFLGLLDVANQDISEEELKERIKPRNLADVYFGEVNSNPDCDAILTNQKMIWPIDTSCDSSYNIAALGKVFRLAANKAVFDRDFADFTFNDLQPEEQELIRNSRSEGRTNQFLNRFVLGDNLYTAYSNTYTSAKVNVSDSTLLNLIKKALKYFPKNMPTISDLINKANSLS